MFPNLVLRIRRALGLSCCHSELNGEESSNSSQHSTSSVGSHRTATATTVTQTAARNSAATQTGAAGSGTALLPLNAAFNNIGKNLKGEEDPEPGTSSSGKSKKVPLSPCQEDITQETSDSPGTPRCRFCFQTGSSETSSMENDDRFIAPCECRGSSRWVHERCLKTWQRTLVMGLQGAQQQEAALIGSGSTVTNNLNNNPNTGPHNGLHCSVCRSPFLDSSTGLPLKPPTYIDMLEEAVDYQIRAKDLLPGPGTLMLSHRETDWSGESTSTNASGSGPGLPFVLRVLVQMKGAHFRKAVYVLLNGGPEEDLPIESHTITSQQVQPPSSFEPLLLALNLTREIEETAGGNPLISSPSSFRSREECRKIDAFCAKYPQVRPPVYLMGGPCQSKICRVLAMVELFLRASHQ